MDLGPDLMNSDIFIVSLVKIMSPDTVRVELV